MSDIRLVVESGETMEPTVQKALHFKRTGSENEEAVERAVTRAIDAMHDNLGEKLTIDDMARAAMFSKFHFSRVFRKITGISPGRFLSALRLEEAKRLLQGTDLTVTEISHRVGYASVGTFSSRFTIGVGVSPSSYRQLGGRVPEIPTCHRRNCTDPRPVTLRGEVHQPTATDLGLVFIGLFREPIPQATPVCCTVLHRPGPFELTKVPAGSWYVLAQSLPDDAQNLTGELNGTDVFVGSYGPLTIRPGTSPSHVDLELRSFGPLDPPVLMALLDARKVALSPLSGRGVF